MYPPGFSQSDSMCINNVQFPTQCVEIHKTMNHWRRVPIGRIPLLSEVYPLISTDKSTVTIRMFGTGFQQLMDNTDHKPFPSLLLTLECCSSLETSTAETYPGAKLGGQLELTHLCLQKPSSHINVFYRCPVVIYSAQKNMLNSTKKGAGFNAQPASCMSPPPAARVDTGELFMAKGPDLLLWAQGGASPTFPMVPRIGQLEGVIPPYILGCACCCWSHNQVLEQTEQMWQGLPCSKQRIWGEKRI